ncbi:MAG: Gfo/Idh/MocA family oxidoreductase [Oscillospiraceae bacterium]|nr:Gfo/Idh/MocA family oxidoreductase [Oscillospiraceae bacterium]
MELRYGILSTSSIAPRFIGAVREANAGDICALSSRTLEKAEQKAKEWNIPVAYGSHAELLADENINIVYISNVNTQHYPWAKAALEAGKHVICEKPCTTSSAQTKELYALAREKKLFFMEAEKMLLLPAVHKLRELIENGTLGRVWMAELNHSFPAAYNAWMFDEAAGGGPLLSSGIYAIQLLVWLFGAMKSTSGIASKMPNGVEWQYVLSGETESGVLFSAKNSTSAVLQNTARICGSNGWAELPEYWKARKLILHLQGKEPEILEFPCKNELVYEAKHIEECIAKGLLNSPVVTEDISVKGIEAIESIKAKW